MKKKFNINIFDIFIILIFLVLIFLLVNRKNIKSNIGKEEKRTVIITAEAKDDITRDAIKDLKPGDKLFAQETFQDGEIISVDIQAKKNELVKTNGEIVVVDDAEFVNPIVKIKANVNYTGPYMSLGGQEIKAGVDMYVKTKDHAYLGYITNVEEVDENNR